ncbi:hypothetical protein BD310DRAFT_977267 [Dichomitus squalens]|uniref:BHLH domain-containing protein n=1 Tax=Dichomitus squalens TaxID=114155 RepID=A0A4Q9PVH4_9APHY|nr:hypothetical protein BD310DRAFT_977267 [Dichomitus squalens]
MVMTLPLTIPGAPSAGNCPTSMNHSQTHVSPSSSVQPLALRLSRVLPPLRVRHKRKPSRRASTTERRATYNAVDCARRKTLNGLFSGLVEEDGADGDYADNDYGDDDVAGPAPDVDPFAHNVSQCAYLQAQTSLPHPATFGLHAPIIVQSPSAVSFENSITRYDWHPHAANQMHAQFMGQYIQ